MERDFATLIADYQKHVSIAVKLLGNSGVEMPYSNREWSSRNEPIEGQLPGGVRYMRHGHGICLDLPTGEVDFDFGDQGETTGFDEWRLEKFICCRPSEYPHSLTFKLDEWLQTGISKGDLIRAPHGLYYIADVCSGKNREVDQIITEGCGLPHQSQDKILTLYSECFLSADVMLSHYRSTEIHGSKSLGLSRSKRVKLRVYLLSWLGYLHSTMEGFQATRVRLLLQQRRHHSFEEVIPQFDELNSLFKRHADDLRILRNNVFHLPTDDAAIEAFFSRDEERLDWAKELHRRIEAFFSNYRITAESYYFESGRMSESVIRSVARERRLRRAKAKRATTI